MTCLDSSRNSRRDSETRIRQGLLLSTATGQHGAEFGNLGVDAELLLFKTFYGGIQYLRQAYRLRREGCLWLRVDGPKGSLAFDNMQTRSIKGTTAWQNYEVVLDVAAEAKGIAFGILMSGTGSVWINSVKMDVVGTNIPTTEVRTPQPSAPANLALEGAATGAPRGWILAGNKPASYNTGVETDAGRASAYLKSKDPAIEGFGTLMQMFDAQQYLGKRVRFSGSVKAEGVQKWAGLWMRVDKQRDSVAFDNMQGRPIKGTTGWQSYTVVLDVPQDATGIALGILLDGTGAVWLNKVGVEVVGTDVATTGQQMPKAPANLGFEK